MTELKLSVRVGAAVGAWVVGDDVGACVGGRMGGGGDAFTPAMVVAPAITGLGAVSVRVPVVSCTVPVMEAAGKFAPAGTVSWMVATSTSPETVPSAG